jgi:hypothetical protein
MGNTSYRLLMRTLLQISFKHISSSLTTACRTALGSTQPPIQWVPGALSLGVKRPGREADHSPPSNTEVKNACSYTSTPQYVFMAWCLVKAQGQLYLYLLPLTSFTGVLNLVRTLYNTSFLTVSCFFSKSINN